jgi:lysozyme
MSSATFVGSAMDSNVDRRGMDYANWELDQSDPNLCRNACLREQPRCKAFTYVKPGVQGPRSRCYLSSQTTAQVRNDCCTSGIVSTPLYSRQDLTNEPSRSELFELIARARGAGRTPPAGSVPVLKAPFKFPDDVLYDVGRARGPSLFGIDISHYTLSTIPLEQFASMKVRFVYLKASQGIRGKDSKFDSFWQRLGNLPHGSRVHRGAYHFLSADADGTQQAKFYVSVLTQNGGIASTDMPPVVDLEWDKASLNEPDRWEPYSSKQILAVLLDWLKTVERETGRTPMIYTNSVWWDERMRTEDFTSLAHYKVWVADYSIGDLEIEKPSVPQGAPWDLWQFTAKALLATGFDREIDATIFKGNEAAFYTAFNLSRF